MERKTNQNQNSGFVSLISELKKKKKTIVRKDVALVQLPILTAMKIVEI